MGKALRNELDPRDSKQLKDKSKRRTSEMLKERLIQELDSPEVDQSH